MITIYKNEDTEFADSEPIKIVLDTDMDLTGFTAEIAFLGVTKTFDSDTVATKVLPLSFTEEDTKGFVLGRDYAIVRLFDPKGRSTIFALPEFDVKLRGSSNDEKNKDEDEGQEDKADTSSLTHAENSIKSNTDVINQIVDLMKKKK